MAPPHFSKRKRAHCFYIPLVNPREKQVTVIMFLVLLSPPHIPNVSHRCIFNSIAILLLGLRALPQSTKGISARGYHPLLANPREKLATVSSSAVFLFFFHPQCFLVVAFIIQLLFHCWHQRPFLCQKGNHYVSLS